jgi:hypothetical protein
VIDSFLVDLVAVALALTVLYARPVTVLTTLIGTVMLIPATLVTPHLHTSYATVDHLVIGATALRLAAMARTGAMRRDNFRATPLHLALALFGVTVAVVGIVFAPATEVTATAEIRMVDLLFAIAFFIVTLALLREIDDPWLTMRLLTGALAISAVIAVIEHFTRDAYGHWIFSFAGHPGDTDAAHILETRAGHVRVRSSGEFALAYSWVAVMLLPIATLVALRIRRFLRIGVPVVAIVVLAIYWTYSRSAAAAVPAAFLLLAMAIRDRRTLAIGGATALGAFVLFAADPTVRHHLSLATDPGSAGIRFQRLPPILEAVSHHPYLGLGFGGLQSIGVSTTDNFYLSTYGETGVIGAAVLVALCLTALAQTARGITVSDRMRRAVIAASVIGFIAFLASGAFDDALLLGQPFQVALLLLAIATATAEPELGFTLLPKWSTPRVIFLTAAGVVAGLVAFMVAPVVVSQERSFSTVSALGNVLDGNGAVGPALIGTICDIAKSVESENPGTHISCRDDFTAPGVGTLRVESSTESQTLAAFADITADAYRVYYLSGYLTYPKSPPVSSRATPWKTAPISGGVVGFALAFIAPLPLRRRKPTTPAPVDDEPPSPPPPPPPSKPRRPIRPERPAVAIPATPRPAAASPARPPRDRPTPRRPVPIVRPIRPITRPEHPRPDRPPIPALDP